MDNNYATAVCDGRHRFRENSAAGVQRHGGGTPESASGRFFPLLNQRRTKKSCEETGMASFGIRTPTDLLNKLIEEQRDFEKSHCLSARHAINAAMTGYHLREWVWGAFVKGRPDLHRTWRLSSGKRSNCKHFKKWLESQCPAFANAEKVTDGTKHFDASAITTGEHKGAFQRSAFQANAFDVGYLWIEQDGRKRYAEELIKELVDYWTAFFEKYSVS
jgi:hypothetical protein